MELKLIRTYFPNGTNGELYYNDKRLCFTIELLWLQNKSQVSCVPEGRYEVVKRFSEHNGWHLLLKEVKGRALFLIHPANDALKEHKDRIASVYILTAEG